MTEKQIFDFLLKMPTRRSKDSYKGVVIGANGGGEIRFFGLNENSRICFATKPYKAKISCKEWLPKGNGATLNSMKFRALGVEAGTISFSQCVESIKKIDSIELQKDKVIINGFDFFNATCLNLYQFFELNTNNLVRLEVKPEAFINGEIYSFGNYRMRAGEVDSRSKKLFLEYCKKQGCDKKLILYFTPKNEPTLVHHFGKNLDFCIVVGMMKENR